jgi:hypothetical protein
MARSLPPVALLIPLSCGPTNVTIPEIPNLQSTIALFEQPTGTVPIESASAQVAEAGRRLDALESSRLADLLGDELVALRKRVVENHLLPSPDLAPDPDKPEVDGYLRVHRICKGWDDASTTPDAASGTLDMLGQTQVFVHPFLDGPLVLALEGALPETAAQTRAVVQLDATLGVENRTSRLSFAFRILEGRLEVAVPVSDGQIVVARDPNGFQMRGSNGTFTCSIETGTCQ